jgi:hypothetical protein
VSKEENEKIRAIIAEGVAREGLGDIVLPPEEAAARRLADMASDEAVDRMIADAEEAGIALLDGPDGLISQLTAKVVERALGVEMDDHLGYVKGDRAGNGPGNSRNGSYGKTVTTSAGPVGGRCGSRCRGTAIPRSSRRSSARGSAGPARSMT